MPASASYLTKYLNAGTTTNGNSNGTTSSPGDFEDSSRPKKRRKKDRHVSTTDTNTGTGALFIADDDEGLLLSATSKVRNEEDEDGPLVYSGNVKSVEFRKKKGSTWRAVGGAGGAGGQIQEQEQIQTQVGSTATVQQNEPGDGDREEDEATKILNAAAEESAQRNALINDEDAPTIVGEIITTEPKRPVMSSGAPAGLQTAEDTAALARLAAQSTDGDANGNSESATRKKRRPKDSKEAEPEPETIYRDATGRRIDISLARSEARAAAAAKLAAEKKAREDAMGEVQLREREEQKRELEEARYLTVGRDVDDEEMNERLKGTVRWDDPMAGYMEEKRRDGRGKDGGTGEVNSDGDGGGVGRTTRRGRKEYAGAAAPNRYGIRPGWRWDGVDRGNGFEKEWFQARGKKTRNENLEYQWAYDE